MYCVVTLLHFFCPCIVHIFHVYFADSEGVYRPRAAIHVFDTRGQIVFFDTSRYMRINADTCEYMRIHACEYTHTYVPNTCEYMRIHACEHAHIYMPNTCEYMRIHACEHAHIYMPNTCEYILRMHANACEYMAPKLQVLPGPIHDRYMGIFFCMYRSFFVCIWAASSHQRRHMSIHVLLR